MASAQFDTFFRHLRRVVLPRAGPELTDAQLLERFVRSRDEAAFELLLWRHGPMVFRVCLRVLRRHHDAEDAFQATFLALARKAGAIGRMESVGSWLYKVAYRIALRAGAAIPARRLPENLLPDPSAPEPILDVLARETELAVEGELNRLPDKYRIAFVMCHVEGQTIAAAAQTLGCPPATVGTRLARARQLLRRRLARRGFEAVPTLSPLPVLPAALVSATVRAALVGTAAEAEAAGMISAHVAALAKGALRTMPSIKWILIAAVVLPLSLLAGGGAFLARCFHAEEVRVVQPDKASQRPAADDHVTLQWKFEKDKPFYQEMTTITRQDMFFLNANANGVYGHEQTLYFSWRPVRRDKDGNWVLKQKVEAVRFAFEENGKKLPYEYDSRKDPGGVPTLVAHYCKQFVGSEFTLTFGKDGKIQRDKKRDDLMKRLVRYNPALQTHDAQVLSDAALRQSAEILLNPLNPKPVRPGDSWTWNQTLNLRPIGNIESRYRFGYGRSAGKLIRIDVQSTLEGKKLQGKDKELKGKGTGTILFDPGKGRIVSEELDLRLEGKIDFVSQGMRLVPPRDPAAVRHDDVKLKQRQKITVKTSDANLAELKGK
jgi:RNA polymerase sigma factor (sigma-70 family)